jgi:hypothetical protein
MQASRRAGTWLLCRRQRSGNVMARVKIRHPEVMVQLTGTDGDAFAVLGAVKNALAGAGVSESGQAEFWTEATARDYDTLLQACMRWVDVSWMGLRRKPGPGVAWFAAEGQHAAVRCRSLARPA